MVEYLNRTHKYNHQIAYIKCSHGWIYQLEVFDQSLGEVGPFEDPKRCGVGIVLTELCLIDPTINNLQEGNLAFDYLEDQQTAFDFVVKYCQKLVGLLVGTLISRRPLECAMTDY